MPWHDVHITMRGPSVLDVGEFDVLEKSEMKLNS